MPESPELNPGQPPLEEIDRSQAVNTLLSAIEEAEGTAIGRESDPLSIDRAEALNYYLGNPLGNEIEGRSQVVSKDLFDTVEWLKPSLLRVFAGGDQIAEFTPQEETDIAAAEQESDYVNYIIQRKNDWFSICNEWFSDALITRNAYCMASWEVEKTQTLERYKGLTEEQLVLLAMDPGVQIVAHVSYPAPAPIPAPMMLNAIQQGMLQAFPQITLHDVDLRKTGEYGCVKLKVLPPERCLVASDTAGVSLQDATFFEYWDKKPISDLRAEGFDVPDDISDSGGTDTGIVDQTRDYPSKSALFDTDSPVDRSMRKVKVRSVWVRNDFDGDGIAELRYVVVVGRTILWNEECALIPVAAIVPYPMPHRHIGLSMYDAVGDLQRIKTAMQRQVVDNAYLANNARTAVDKNLVNLDDMAVSRPGGIVRVDGAPGAAILPFPQVQTAQHGIAVLNYFDEIRADRGGVQKPYGGSDLQAIQAQPGTVAQLASIASQKIEQLARILSSGVKELFQIVHYLTLTNATMPEKVQLRGKWATVDPRQWKKRADMTLLVGMGILNRQAHLSGISALLGLQEKALGVGLTSPGKIYNALSEYVKAMGFSSPKQFFDEPDPQKPYQPSPPHQIVVAQINAQADLLAQRMKNQTDLALTQLKEEAAATRSYFETSIQAQSEAQDRFIRAVSEATERMQELRLESMRQEKNPTMNISVDGANVADNVRGAKEKAEATSKRLEEVVKELEQIKSEPKKPKVFTIKAPSGKTYTVEKQ